MLCPECGEVLAPGPLDLRCACPVERRRGLLSRLWRVVFRRPLSPVAARDDAIDLAELPAEQGGQPDDHVARALGE